MILKNSKRIIPTSQYWGTNIIEIHNRHPCHTTTQKKHTHPQKNTKIFKTQVVKLEES